MAGTAQERKRYSPLVLTETGSLSREQWLEYRRLGIGGSDVAAIIGLSPFRTARDVYYDKLGIAAVEGYEGNWVAMEMGNLLEGLVAEIFRRKTGLEVYQVKKMFQHPDHRFMLADVDSFITTPDGTKAILELKTTNYNAKDRWWRDGREIVPPYYETQGRHYMAVTDIDRVFFCCLYGNTEDEAIIREIRRDAAYEEEMIFLERQFWEDHVQKKVPPPYLEDGDVIQESLPPLLWPGRQETARHLFGRADGIQPDALSPSPGGKEGLREEHEEAEGGHPETAGHTGGRDGEQLHGGLRQGRQALYRDLQPRPQTCG